MDEKVLKLASLDTVKSEIENLVKKRMMESNLKKAVLPIVLLADISGSTNGTAISKMNRFLGEFREVLTSTARNGSELSIAICGIEFATEAEWMFDSILQLVDEDFYFQMLGCEGYSNLGKALVKMNTQITKENLNKWFSKAKVISPIVFLFHDGYSTDSYAEPLKKFKNENFVPKPMITAFSFADDCDYEALVEITGNPQAVVLDDYLEASSRIISRTLNEQLGR